MMKRVCALAVALYPVLFAQAAILPGNHASRAEKYLFYLHGKILEDQGIPRPRSERYGYYEYEKIVETFHSRGFTVRSEIRPPNTQVLAYAEKIAGEIRGLLRSGVAPGRITVVGASKGGVIAIFISALLQERDIHFVFLASCHEAVYRNLQEMGMRIAGNILSIYDAADDTGCGSCRNSLPPPGRNGWGATRKSCFIWPLGTASSTARMRNGWSRSSPGPTMRERPRECSQGNDRERLHASPCWGIILSQ